MEKIITLKNGRIYRLVDTKEPYINGEYPKGGIIIFAWSSELNSGNGMWVYIDNSPDEECVKNFLSAMERLKF